jgi:hypothetical protein
MGQAQQSRRAVLIVEHDAELRYLTPALLEDEQNGHHSAQAQKAALQPADWRRDVAMIFADGSARACTTRVASPNGDRHRGKEPNNPRCRGTPRGTSPLNFEGSNLKG